MNPQPTKQEWGMLGLLENRKISPPFPGEVLAVVIKVMRGHAEKGEVTFYPLGVLKLIADIGEELMEK